MKPYIYFIALLFLGISCGKDFLEENPKGVLDPGIFFSSSPTFQRAGVLLL